MAYDLHLHKVLLKNGTSIDGHPSGRNKLDPYLLKYKDYVPNGLEI